MGCVRSTSTPLMIEKENSMPRLYISLSDADLKRITEDAKAYGMSAAGYVLYLVNLSIAPADAERNTADILRLRKTMYTNLEKIDIGERFIVSALFDSSTWGKLPSIQKRQLAQELSSYCKSRPESFCIKKIHGLNQYLKIEKE